VTRRFPGIRRVIHKRTLPSTQTLARELADGDAPEWTLVLADQQSRGRGRLARKWSSGRGGLYFSLILRPRMRPAALPALSLQAGRICARVLAKETGLRTRVKPPNDVLARDARGDFRKICGILIEAAGGERTLDWVVIGIGVNLDNRIPGKLEQAASIKDLGGDSASKHKLLAALLRALRKAWRAK